MAEGLLDRRPDPTDRRAVVVSISKKGRQVLRQIQLESSALLTDIYAEIGLSAQELGTYRDVLTRINEALARRWFDYIAQKDARSTSKP